MIRRLQDGIARPLALAATLVGCGASVADVGPSSSSSTSGDTAEQTGDTTGAELPSTLCTDGPAPTWCFEVRALSTRGTPIDLDGDGLDDLLHRGDDAWTGHRNLGNAGFEEIWSVAPPLESYFLAVAPDAAYSAARLFLGARFELDSQLVEYAASTMGLELVGEIPVTHDWFFGGAVVFDANGDGVQDLAIPAESAARLLVLLGQAEGGYVVLPEEVFDEPVSGRAGIAVGDVDGDGNIDLLMSQGRPSVFFGDGAGRFAVVVEVPMEARGPIYVSDLDGDGRGDLVTADPLGFILAFTQADGTFRFVEQGRGEGVQVAEAFNLVPADLDADGLPELVGFRDDVLTFDGVSSHFEARLHVFSDIGDQGFASDRSVVFEDTCDRQEETFAPTPRVLELDGDGQPDFLFDWTTFCPEDFTFTPLALLYRPA